MWQHLTDTHHNQGPSRIDSVQNGLLLNATFHVYWDSWCMSINPVCILLVSSKTVQTTMRLWFFLDTQERVTYDGNLVQFTDTADLPAPPHALLYEHFKQAVLANMRGAGEVQLLNFDPGEDSQSMDIFEKGAGKIFLETYLKDRLPITAKEEDDQTL